MRRGKSNNYKWKMAGKKKERIKEEEEHVEGDIEFADEIKLSERKNAGRGKNN